MHELWELKQKQSLPLGEKINASLDLIREWYEYWGGQVYVSFSGGKDSTVLLHLVRSIYPDVSAVFIDTGLEYPEIRDFVKTVNNVIWLKPKMNFRKVIETYGYPIISKEVSKIIYGARHSINKKENYKARLNGLNSDGTYSKFRQGFIKYKYLLDAPFEISNRCCLQIKENPAMNYEKESDRKPFIATMACESKQRKDGWLKTGCNAFAKNKNDRNISKPMSFWTEQDILQYLREFNIPYASIYGDIVEEMTQYKKKENKPTGKLITTGCDRTGCIFCMYGCHLEKEPNRFQRLRKTHPKLYDYCMRDWSAGGLGLKNVLDYINVKY